VNDDTRTDSSAPFDVDEPLPISLVCHHVFCPRRAWLEVHGERTDTAQMAHGVAAHEQAHDEASSRRRRMHAVEVRSEQIGVVGRCDTVEVDDAGALTLVEHKATPVRRSARVTDAQRVQLALQALCLREAGHRVDAASIYFSTLRRRVAVQLDDELFDRARAHVSATRKVVNGSMPPAPLEDDPRCGSCSHVGVCLPDEHRERASARRIGVADPTGHVLHLASPGSRASLSRGQIAIRAPDQDPVKVPLGHVSGVVAHSNVDLSSALVRELLERGLPIVWCTWSGRVVGWATGADGPNGDARAFQHRLAESLSLQAARAMIAAKIRNQASLLRRHLSPQREVLRSLARQASAAPDIASLLGVEGRAAALYFPALSAALTPDWARIERRTARPARDEVNAALNVAYSLLLADVLRAVVACGLDPHGGVLHSPIRNKPALALDLMEEMRAPVADSAVLWAINNGELRERDFRRDLDAFRMTPRGRRALIAAYERRATTEFRHPHFGYRVTWRRAMEVQARMFLALVMGEASSYRPVELR
jgi:CRISPR-associated protein Cas1